MTARICAAPGCDNPLPPRRPGRIGRPPIYCSAQCRPTRTPSALSVEVDPVDTGDSPSRDWQVRLRRGSRTVVIQTGLGRFAATALAADIHALITGEHRP